MRSCLSVLAAALLAAAVPATARAADPVAVATGGGVAEFTSAANPALVGATSAFGLSAQVNADGSATGHFTCVIPGVLALTADVSFGSVNDDGSVTVAGDFDLHFAGGGTLSGLPYELTVHAGGAGDGSFVFCHPLGCDVEVITAGRLNVMLQ